MKTGVHLRVAPILLTALLTVVAGCQTKPNQKPPSSPPSFTLRASLVTEDGKPLEGASCMVGKDNPKGFMWEVGPDGKLANPTAKSDNQGRLQFQVNRSFLPPNRKIMLGCSTPEHLDLEPLMSKDGGVVVIEVDPQLTVLDLDKIVGKIVVKRR